MIRNMFIEGRMTICNMAIDFVKHCVGECKGDKKIKMAEWHIK